MKVELMSRDKLETAKIQLSQLQQSVFEDLGLSPILNEMSGDNVYLKQVVLKTWFTPMLSKSEIEYRQEAVADSFTHQSEINEIYQLVTQTVRRAREDYWTLSSGSASYRVISSARKIKNYLKYLNELMRFSNRHWNSKNFQDFFNNLDNVFSPAKMTDMNNVIDAILAENNQSYYVKLLDDFSSGIKDSEYNLKKDSVTKMVDSIRDHYEKKKSKFSVAERDDNSLNAITEYENFAKSALAIKIVNTANEFDNFFDQLKFQTAFLLGVVNLRSRLSKYVPITFPKVSDKTHIQELRNVTLQLHLGDKPAVGNDLTNGYLSLLIISGANQGGKTTMLRAIGQAQIMMTSGMFVVAKKYVSALHDGIYTHFKREEDSSLKIGKLENELKRMAMIVDVVTPSSLVLMNESFSSTNEYEGSQISAQIISGLVNSHITVVAVTHQYEFLKLLNLDHNIEALFLRPERKSNGNRSYKMLVGLPTKTSFGLDIFNKFFHDKPTSKLNT